MKCVIEIDMDNAAFEEDGSIELSRILGDLTSYVESVGIINTSIRDSNGNTVGTMRFQERIYAKRKRSYDPDYKGRRKA